MTARGPQGSEHGTGVSLPGLTCQQAGNYLNLFYVMITKWHRVADLEFISQSTGGTGI